MTKKNLIIFDPFWVKYGTLIFTNCRVIDLLRILSNITNISKIMVGFFNI